MKREWKVVCRTVGGEKKFAVCRQAGKGRPKPGNLEFATGYLNSKEAAQAACDRMNSLEGGDAQ